MEVLLVHPGGPFFRKKNLGIWSIVKGEHLPDEEPLAAAIREFGEETGWKPAPPFLALGEVEQSRTKRVTAWAFAGDYVTATLKSNTFLLEYPPGSGVEVEVPEVDRAEWFTLPAAERVIIPGQRLFLERLAEELTR